MPNGREEEKIIICSGKSASLSLDSALAAAGKKKWVTVRQRLEMARSLIDEAMAEMEGE